MRSCVALETALAVGGSLTTAGSAGRPDGDGGKGEGQAHGPRAQVQGRGQGVEDPGGESTCLATWRERVRVDACAGVSARWEQVFDDGVVPLGGSIGSLLVSPAPSLVLGLPLAAGSCYRSRSGSLLNLQPSSSFANLLLRRKPSPQPRTATPSSPSPPTPPTRSTQTTTTPSPPPKLNVPAYFPPRRRSRPPTRAWTTLSVSHSSRRRLGGRCSGGCRDSGRGWRIRGICWARRRGILGERVGRSRGWSGGELRAREARDPELMIGSE